MNLMYFVMIMSKSFTLPKYYTGNKSQLQKQKIKLKIFEPAVCLLSIKI